jgi:hypothetical protein
LEKERAKAEIAVYLDDLLREYTAKTLGVDGILGERL